MTVSKKKEIKSKTIFIHKFLEFCYFLVFELRNQHDCVEEQEEGIMNGDYIMHWVGAKSTRDPFC